MLFIVGCAALLAARGDGSIRADSDSEAVVELRGQFEPQGLNVQLGFAIDASLLSSP